MAGRGRAERNGLGAALAVLGVILGLDVFLGPRVVISGSYAIAAVVAAATTTTRRTASVAAAATVLSALSGLWNHNFATLDWELRLVLTTGLGVLATQLARMRTHREQALRHMTVIAETAQRALLGAMPSAIGSVGVAARYVSATQEALVGGDLYEAAATPYGVRVVVGDVRGKGLDAVHLAGTVLGAFRRQLFTQPSLTAIATDLDEVVTAVAGDEDFVTVILAEFREDHSVSLVNCGHHPPLLVTDAGLELLPPDEPAPPLGLHPAPRPVTYRWPQGSRILIYTDGLVEARNRLGAFFPLVDQGRVLREGSLDEALDRLLARLTDHAGPHVKDDMALVLVGDLAA